MPTNKYGYLTRRSQAISSAEFDFTISVPLQENSDVSQIGRSLTRWATLEKDRLKLDVGLGERFYLANEYDKVGVVSQAQSNEDGYFVGNAVAIIATVKNNKYVSQSGITYVGGDFITSATVNAYRDNTLVSTYQFTKEDTLNTDLGYEKKQVFFADFEVINRIEFIVWQIEKPHRFFYCFDFRLEADEEFKSDELLSVEATNKVSIYGDVLEYSTLDFELKKDQYDRIFQKNEAISLVTNDESFLFFSQQSTENKNTYTVNCSDFTSLLEGEFLGGMFKNVNIEGLIEGCLGKELSKYFLVGSSINHLSLTGYISVCTKREAMQQILLAVNARKYKSGGVEAFSAFKTQLNPFVYDESKIIGEPSIIRNEPLKKLIVREHNYTPNNEAVEVYNYAARPGTKVVFSEPFWKLRVFRLAKKGGSSSDSEEYIEIEEDASMFIEAHTNYCVFKNIYSNYDIIIRGLKYTDSVVEYIKVNPYVVENQDYLTKTIDLYIHSDTQAVCDFLYELYSRPYSIKFSTLYRPELGGYYEILGHKLNIKSITETLSGVYEVEAC